MDIIVHGADTETYYGMPHTLQFFSDDMEYETCIWVDDSTATSEFIRWADKLPRMCLHVVYVHNLEFDLPEFFWSVKEKLLSVAGNFSFQIGQWNITGVYGKPTFCRMTNRKRNTTILIVDSFLWFQSSLAKAADLFCPDLPKLKTPKGLGTCKFSMRDDAFYAYAMRDAEVAYHIGKSVQAIHREFNIRQAVSLADMSAKIFRHHFLDYTIPQPKHDVILAALKSYHGGKNNVVSGMAPAWHTDIVALDIKSAYPLAMYDLPAFSNKRLYKRFPKVNRSQRKVPPFGVYCVSGNAAPCDWPVVFEHNFKPIQGDFSNVWIQGIELNEALRNQEVKIKSIRGFYYEHERDKQTSALKEFVTEFYRRKETEKNPTQRYMYKIVLNALYGKFIQTRKNSRVIYTDVDANETEETNELIAGGMFHPFIASAITAHTRAYIHQIEHAHQAIHTATDGIFTYAKKIKQVPMSPRGRSTLGKLTIENKGDVVILRNKCYIFYGEKTKDSIKSQYFKGKHILKFAKHGFQGTVYDLERLVAHNRRKYTSSRPNKLRESMRRGLNVNEFVERDYVLKVGPIKVRKLEDK